MTFTGFTQDYFDFFNDLSQHNDRDWFAENKQRYEDHVAEPLCAFVAAIAPLLEKISPYLVANPKRSGGSMFRIYRDTRFAKDKTPYKTHGALQFRHSAGKDVHAPGFYLSAGPGEIVLGLGIWKPDGPSVQKIRTAIAEKSEAWLALRDNPEFRETFTLTGESLKRPPKGFDKDHPLIEDLKRKDFIGMHPLTPAEFFSPDLPELAAARFTTAKPYVRFICDALGLPF